MGAEIRRERVVLETERYTIVGNVTLPAEGFHSRLSDLLNREGVQFIPLVDATISGRDGETSGAAALHRRGPASTCSSPTRPSNRGLTPWGLTPGVS